MPRIYNSASIPLVDGSFKENFNIMVWCIDKEDKKKSFMVVGSKQLFMF